MRKAIGYYEEAIGLDPGYAAAYAKLSIAAEIWPTTTGVLRRRKDKRRSQKRAPPRSAQSSWIQIWPRPIWPRPYWRNLDFNFATAETEYRRAVELAPHNAGVTSSLGHLAVGAWPARRSGRGCRSGRLRSSRYGPDSTSARNGSRVIARFCNATASSSRPSSDGEVAKLEVTPADCAGTSSTARRYSIFAVAKLKSRLENPALGRMGLGQIWIQLDCALRGGARFCERLLLLLSSQDPSVVVPPDFPPQSTASHRRPRDPVSRIAS